MVHFTPEYSKTLEKKTIDRFRYYFNDLDKFTKLPLNECLGACKAFYNIQNNLPLDAIDKQMIAYYLHSETEILMLEIMVGMNIELHNLSENEAYKNIEQIRTQTKISNKFLDLEAIQVGKNDYEIMLIINLIF